MGEGPICLITRNCPQRREEIDVEGCLSIPGLRAYVKRSTSVIVKALDERAGPSGSLATASWPVRSSEIDHLNGVLMTTA